MAFSKNTDKNTKTTKVYAPTLSIVKSSRDPRHIHTKNGDRTIHGFFCSADDLRTFLTALDEYEEKTGKSPEYVNFEYWEKN